ncbi:MAG: TadE/TadG family type IV pilus assembly protein [Massilia sp.]
MSRPKIQKMRGSQRGTAAVEFAIILPLMVMILAVPLFFARYFWYYEVIQKAATDSARLLSSSSQVELGSFNADLSEVAVAKLARSIVTAETAEISTGTAIHVEVRCGSLDCIGDGVPQTVRVAIRMRIYDTFFGGLTDEFGGNVGLWVRADVTMPYVGN